MLPMEDFVYWSLYLFHLHALKLGMLGVCSLNTTSFLIIYQKIAKSIAFCVLTFNFKVFSSGNTGLINSANIVWYVGSTTILFCRVSAFRKAMFGGFN